MSAADWAEVRGAGWLTTQEGSPGGWWAETHLPEVFQDLGRPARSGVCWGWRVGEGLRAEKRREPCVLSGTIWFRSAVATFLCPFLSRLLTLSCLWTVSVSLECPVCTVVPLLPTYWPLVCASPVPHPPPALCPAGFCPSQPAPHQSEKRAPQLIPFPSSSTEMPQPPPEFLHFLTPTGGLTPIFLPPQTSLTEAQKGWGRG